MSFSCLFIMLGYRVDIRSTGSALKFGKCIPVRRHQLMNEYAVCIQHFTSSTYIHLNTANINSHGLS